MLSIIYPYRNRDLVRIKNSFNSLERQTTSDFKVYFVDYGSTPEIATDVQRLCASYTFVTYSYCNTRFQPWNKSRALNSVIKGLATDFCLVADVDMIFHPDFVQTAIDLQKPEQFSYFKVAFMEEGDSLNDIEINNFKDYRISTLEATGISMFPVKILKKLRGFDEFYHFWGAEDTDMHIRLKNAGYRGYFYENEVLVLHQWHPSYRSKEKTEFVQDFQIQGIVDLNHRHLQFAKENKVTMVNTNSYGEIMDSQDLRDLESTEDHLVLNNQKRNIDDLLYGQLPVMRDRTIKIIIEKDPFHGSLKFRVKKILGKKVPTYYTFKEINDLLLLHLISFYRDKPYTYKIDQNLTRITCCIAI